MKKAVFVIATVFLMSCGGSSDTPVSTDSLPTPGFDSTLVDSSLTATDSNTAHIK